MGEDDARHTPTVDWVVNMTRRYLLGMPLVAMGAPLLPTRGELDRLIAAMEKALFQGIVPFWVEKTIDPAGGYLLHHDAQGKPLGPGVRGVETQAGMVWLYARLARMGHEPKRMLEAAEHGAKFLRERMWDGKYGGFYWEVDALGKPTKANKHVLAQAWAIEALAELGLAGGKKEWRGFVLGLIELLEKQAHDAAHGGYVEYFLKDWATPPVNEPIYVADSAAGMKTMRTHVRMMRAVEELYAWTKAPVVKERLLELIAIASSAVYRKPQMAATDKYDRDWSPRLEGTFGEVHYGMDLENLWGLAEAVRMAGMSVSPYVDLMRASFAYCQRYGYDAAEGGFYRAGQLSQPASDKAKTASAQAEAMVAALELYRLTGSTEYFEVFRKTWAYCEKNLVDRENGDWFEVAGEGPKASVERAGYRHGRAMVECLVRLRQIREKTS